MIEGLARFNGRMTDFPSDPVEHEGPVGKPNPTDVTEDEEAVDPREPNAVDDQ